MAAASIVECFKCTSCSVTKSVNNLSSFSSSKCSLCEASHSSAPRLSLPKVNFLSTASTPHWIAAVGVVQFDLLQGQTLELLYPPLPLSYTQETELSFLSFPDANFARDGDSIHDFVFAYNPSECDPLRTTTRRISSNGESIASATPKKRPFDQDNVVELVCCSLFRQRKDSTITRGAQQKAVVVMSRLPFPSVTHRVATILCHALFDKDASSPEALLKVAFDEMLLWPKIQPNNNTQGAVQLLGEAVQLAVPAFDPSDLLPLHWSGPASVRHFAAAGDEREKLLEALENAAPPAAVSLALQNYLAGSESALECEKVRDAISAVKTPNEGIGRETEFELIAILRTCSVAEEGPSSLPAPRPSLLALFRRSQTIPRRIVTCQNRQLEGLRKRLQVELSMPTNPTSSLTEQPPRSDLFADVDFLPALFPHLSKLWKLWELMIIGAPIGIVGNHAPTVSAVCFGLASLLSPLKFSGTLRPYLTINNREVDFCARDDPSPSTILGATNPYFVRHCAKWPHFLCIGSVNDDVQTHKNHGAHDEKRAKQQFKLSNKMFCSRHYFVKTEKLGAESSVRPPSGPREDYSQTIDSSVPEAVQFLRQFRDMTVDFITPIQDVALSLLNSDRVALCPHEIDRVLDAKVLLEALAVHHRLPTALFKTRQEMLAMYDEFVRSSTFSNLKRKWVKQSFRQVVLSATQLEDLLILEPCPEKRLQVLSVLQRELERTLAAPFLDVPLATKLASMADDIAALREDLAS